MSSHVEIDHQTLQAAVGTSLFECAEAVGVRVPTSCRKQGRCKECMVEIATGADALSPRTADEKHLKGSFRLSCCARLAQDGATVRCHTLQRGQMRIERHAFRLPGRTADWQLAPAVTRDGDRVLLDGVEIDRRPGPLHGLAIDLGTTTVVVRALNLDTGEIVADASFENPQRFGGSDVMARIQYDVDDGSRLLQRTLAAYLAHAIESLPIDPLTIYEVVIAANSTMRDLFFRLSVYSIGQSPYQSVTEHELAAGTRTSTSLVDTPKRLGLPIHPRARVYGLPIISGHVGADAAACMLAINLAHEDRLVALMDIGTNTELIIGHRHKVLAASCPAGPAFEGGDISCGMPGLPGAIERVRITDEGQFELAVIGGGEAEGICGSGLVDLLSELRRHGQMNELGRFEAGADDLVLVDRPDHPLVLRESDVNALAQAKGANVAGLQIAADEYGIRLADIEVFYLAGGFGRHLDIEAAQRIGLIPHLDRSRIVQVGNAAIEGACLALLSRHQRAELEALVRRVTHCRLETHPGFFDFFVEGCQFAPVGLARESQA